MTNPLVVKIELDELDRQYYHADRKVLLIYLEDEIITQDQYSNLLSESIELQRMNKPTVHRLYRQFQQRLFASCRENLLENKRVFDERDYVLAKRVGSKNELGKRPDDFEAKYKLKGVCKVAGLIYLTFVNISTSEIIIEFYKRKNMSESDLCEKIERSPAFNDFRKYLGL